MISFAGPRQWVWCPAPQMRLYVTPSSDPAAIGQHKDYGNGSVKKYTQRELDDANVIALIKQADH